VGEGAPRLHLVPPGLLWYGYAPMRGVVDTVEHRDVRTGAVLRTWTTPSEHRAYFSVADLRRDVRAHGPTDPAITYEDIPRGIRETDRRTGPRNTYGGPDYYVVYEVVLA
jgi:hypothetical protein